MKQIENKKKPISIFCLFLLSIGILIGVFSHGGQRTATDSVLAHTVYAEEDAIAISLFRGHGEVNQPFQEKDLYPGDQKTREYQLSVSWKNNVDVHFRVTLAEQSAKLADVLKIRVNVPGHGDVLYDGSFKDMPEKITVSLLGDNQGQTAVLTYDITVYLDTGVGNDYQNTQMDADFTWWAEEGADSPNGRGTLIPNTGLSGGVTILLPVLLIAAVFFILILFFRRKKRKDEDSEAAAGMNAEVSEEMIETGKEKSEKDE